MKMRWGMNSDDDDDGIYASTMSKTEAYDKSFSALLMICQFQDTILTLGCVIKFNELVHNFFSTKISGNP